MKKINIILILFLLFITGTTIVYAGTNDSKIEKHRFDNAYAIYNGTDRIHLFYAERYTLSGNTAYCIEPGVAINTEVYSSTEDWNISGLSNDVKRYVRLVAYYGYDYSGHGTRNYYLASQELIWEKITGREVYWVSEENVNGAKINIDTEKNEIQRLVANHTVTPSFDESTIEVNVGESKSITDSKGVLSQYQIYHTNLSEVSINGNSLKFKGTSSRSEQEIQLIRKNYTNKVTLIYYNGENQKLVSAGVLDPVIATVKIKTVGGTITPKKLDKETGETPQGDATLKGAKYGIYNIKGELVDTIITSQKDKSIDLPYGNYTIKEISPSKGYELDKNVYSVTIDKKNQDITINVYEDIIKRKVNFFKVYATDKTSMLVGEPDVQFDIYLKSTGKLYKSVTTDSKGYAEVSLVYGKYIVKQATATKDHEKVDDFEIEIKESNEEPIYKLISNAEITARLKVLKVDSESGKIIERANIKFKIYDVINKRYVTQTITYPHAETIDVFSTDSNGILITPYPLSSGIYRLEEVDQKIDGYLWNNEPLEFEIGENSKLINDEEYGHLLEVKFGNTQVKGEVNVKKHGEKVVIKNGKYKYEDVELDGVKYNLYANEDIYSADDTLIYHKGDLVGTYVTKDGKLTIKDLYLGKYYLLETSTVDGYVLDTTKHYFELKYKDQYTPVVFLNFSFKNYLKKGTLEFYKTDVSTGEPLPNTKIEIYTENDELIFSGYTDSNGKIVLKDLFVGKFYLIESEAPEGYTLNTEKMHFEIKENGEVVKATMTDDKLVIEVPNTLKNKEKGLYVSIFSFGILGALLIGAGIYYEKKKNKKKDKEQEKN